MATTKKTYTPKELAAEIGIDPKVLRNHLRKVHTRNAEAKNVHTHATIELGTVRPNHSGLGILLRTTLTCVT